MTIKTILLGLAAAASLTTGAHAIELVTNGSFEADAAGGVQGIGASAAGNSTAITGWTITGHGYCCGLAWYYPAGTADNNGVTAQVYGPQNGHANGFGLSPDGGAMVALDGADTYKASLDQTINGLNIGSKYRLTFYWGGGQQFGFGGPTTEKFTAIFGGESFDTITVSNPEAGWTGWIKETHTFTATSTSQLLSFLATGTPDGQPPFSIIDGVSLTGGVPEASSWAMLIAGFGLVGAAARRRRTAVAA